MSVTVSGVSAPPHHVRRVRHQVRDGLAVVVFSAVTSSTLALLLMLLAKLGNQG